MVFFSRVALESTLYSAGDEEDLWLLEHVLERVDWRRPGTYSIGCGCPKSRAVCFVVPSKLADTLVAGTTFLRAWLVALSFACAPYCVDLNTPQAVAPCCSLETFLTFQASCLVDFSCGA